MEVERSSSSVCDASLSSDSSSPVYPSARQRGIHQLRSRVRGESNYQGGARGECRGRQWGNLGMRTGRRIGAHESVRLAVHGLFRYERFRRVGRPPDERSRGMGAPFAANGRCRKASNEVGGCTCQARWRLAWQVRRLTHRAAGRFLRTGGWKRWEGRPGASERTHRRRHARRSVSCDCAREEPRWRVR